MRAAISLLVLLFSMCGAQTWSTQSEVQTESQSTGAAAAAAEVSTQLDVSAELKELRDMVVELRVTLMYTQDELKAMEAENALVEKRLVASETKVEVLERVLTITQKELQDTKVEMKTEVENLKKENAAQETELTAVKTRLAASEAKVMNLRKETAAQSADLRSVADRLAATETDMEQVKKDTAAQHTDLTTMKTEVMNLTKENAALQTRLAATVMEVEDLKVENAAQEAELTAVKTRLAATETEVDNLEKITEKSKVAFSAGLTDSGYIESGNTDFNLVFSKIITNVGQAYSSTTGFFTAPVRGVYYFRFTVMDLLASRSMNIRMCKNGKHLMLLGDYDTDGQANFQSSGLTLQLEVGDVVNMVLPAGHRLYDNINNYCTFSGFLLFPL
ncbi:hypothetical protein ACEWY4_022655 [Coilia grayii]|uniref:C1q domain-containing protein n=1 Tax=Coilia grayii TaxID=363190 RepID=A0ABD1J165_9TELE